MAWKFRIRDRKSDAKWELTLDQPIVQIGRDRNSDVLLEQQGVSRQHLEISKLDNGGVVVVDSSSNGSFVREQDRWIRIEGRRDLPLPCVLLAGDCTIRIDDEAAAQPVDKVNDEPPARPVEKEAEQTWEESVMVPAANLGQQTEAILVFDICESSLIASQDDHMAYHLKQRLTQIAEPILDEYHRRFFKSTGDGFLATFDDPEKALRAAIDVEDRLQSRNQRTSNTPIHYRIALHYGEVWSISAGGTHDVHGHDVNVTFRIEGVQAPAFADTKALFPKRDRILCSRQFRDVAAQRLDTLVTHCFPCGAASLKGIETPMEIFWLKTKYSLDDLDSTLAVAD